MFRAGDNVAHPIRDANWFQEQLRVAVLFRIEIEIEQVIPASTPAEIRAAIREEVMPHCRIQVKGLTVDELTDENLIQQHLSDAIETTLYLVNRWKKLSDRWAGGTEQVCPDCDGTGTLDLWSGEPCECCDGMGIVET